MLSKKYVMRYYYHFFNMACLLAMGDAVGILENEELLRQLVAEHKDLSWSATCQQLMGSQGGSDQWSCCENLFDCFVFFWGALASRIEENTVQESGAFQYGNLLNSRLSDNQHLFWLIHFFCSKLFFNPLKHNFHPKGLLQQWITQTTRWSWSP